ncbi:MAG TPA: LysR substrate-binding domain-containing protein [Rhodopila sp.]|nr:LysR substrate-binding domain-containing protein [Rhodopila sp.]
MLAQTEAALAAARRAAHPARPSFAFGFLTGQEMDWLPEAMTILRGELPNIDITVSSQSSPQLAGGLMQGRLDLAFMRAERNMPDLVYKVVTQEPLILVLPAGHPLASREVIAIREVAGEPFLGMSKTAPALQIVIDDYLERSGLEIRPAHEIDNLGMAVSLVASTRGVTLLPAYARNFLPSSVISRPLDGQAPMIDLVIGYNKANKSPILKLFLSRTDDLIARFAHKTTSAP